MDENLWNPTISLCQTKSKSCKAFSDRFTVASKLNVKNSNGNYFGSTVQFTELGWSVHSRLFVRSVLKHNRNGPRPLLCDKNVG